MAEPPQKASSPADLTEAPASPDEDRAAILSRRARFIASALAGLAGAAVAIGCTSENASPQPCLSPTGDASGLDLDANLQRDVTPIDATPQPCLQPWIDAAPDAADAAPDAADAGPLPCLAPPLLDSGGGG